MGTSFKELYNYLMTSTIKDYRLDRLFMADENAFCEYLKNFLLKASLECSHNIIHSLDYELVEKDVLMDGCIISVSEYCFKEKLLPLEKLILINYMEIYWYETTMEDILAISSMIGSKSERDVNDKNSLKEKRARIKELRSENYANIRELQQTDIENNWWY